MTKIKRFKLHDTTAHIARKRVSKGRAVDIRRARNFKTAQYEGMK